MTEIFASAVKEYQRPHPRLLLSATDIARVEAAYARDARWAEPLLPHKAAIALLESPAVFEDILNRGLPGDDQWIIDTSLALAWAAAAWRVTRRDVFRDLLKRWQPILAAHPPIRITGFAIENRDLIAGHLLLGLSLAYDVLHGCFDPDFEDAVRAALAGQARQTHADLTDRTIFPTYAYEQNHFVIPVCALGVAALALDEGLDHAGPEPGSISRAEAARWSDFSRQFLARSFDVLARDGWFFEGVSYWRFTMQFPVCYASALRQATGEDLFARPPFRDAGFYLAHMMLPDPEFVFDFSDWGPRTLIDGKAFQRGYERPWHTLPTRLPRSLLLQMARAQGGKLWAEFLGRLPAAPAEVPLDDGALRLLLTETFSTEMASKKEPQGRAGPLGPPPLPLRNSPSACGAPSGRALPFSTPSEECEAGPDEAAPAPYHYFNDMEVIHWRSDWADPDATAIAFKSGPPAGHHLGKVLPQFPDWKLGLGHAHPDAGSFLIFSKGVFLANDTGYTGKKESCDHNCVLVDGIGQHKGGTPWSTFEAKPYADYDRIRLENVWLGAQVAAGEAILEAAYDDSLGMERMRRHFIIVDGRFVLVRDTLVSAQEHEYEWRLHGDREHQVRGPDRFVMENGPGRLVVQNLAPVASHRIAPTIVETELFFVNAETRPQQRGWHLALHSPVRRDFRFLVAMGIQSSAEPEAAFTARQTAPGKVEFADAAGSCTLWLGGPGGSDELDGVFAYCLRDPSGKIRSSGLHGASLVSPELRLDAPGERLGNKIK